MNIHLTALTLALISSALTFSAQASEFTETYQCSGDKQVQIHHKNGAIELKVDGGDWQSAVQSIDYSATEIIFSNANWSFRDQAQSKGKLTNKKVGDSYRCNWVKP